MTKLCIGAVSKNVVHAAIEVAYDLSVPIDIIASRRQVDTDGGYVEGWTQYDLVNFVKERDAGDRIRVCRDHGGPNQGTMQCGARSDALDSFSHDIRAGFQQLHIDVSAAFKSSRRATDEIAWYVDTLSKAGARFEIGAEQQTGRWQSSARSARRMLEYLYEQELLKFVDFVVVQTGAQVVELRNMLTVHDAHDRGVDAAVDLCNEFGIGLKEHNGDYLTAQQLRYRKHTRVAGVNIAPEYGVVETCGLLYECKARNRNDIANEFLGIAYRSQKWKKWMAPASTASTLDRSVIAGHYVFSDPRVVELKAELGEDIDEALRGWVRKRIQRHVEELSG